jgi:isoquinoline 1-oxidoreductase subunit alpha
MAKFTLKINGTSQSVDVEDDTPLLWVLRDNLNLVGTKFSCGIAQCGACTVHINGTATFSCVTPISSVGNAEVTTIEGLSKDGDHPVQKAWEEVDVAQCGYCQSGQIMTAAAFLEQNQSPTLEEIDNAMNRNICRCGTYHKIREAVALAAKTK